ncbi:MAG: hypothetical protein MMC23_006650 [Stictis urceolatum]|nr:hypothetical protein [Stictis urceolata]
MVKPRLTMLYYKAFLLLFSVQTLCKGIPKPTGPYHVGVTQHVLPHTTPHDVTAPNGTGASILLTFFYPSLHLPPSPRKYLTPQTAALFEPAANYPPGTLSNLTSSLHLSAPPLPSTPCTSTHPTLIFQPGGTGPPVEVYQILLPSLASHGYTIAALDHTYEQPFVQYPDGGPGIYGLPLDVQLNATFDQAIYDFRLSDTDAFLEFYPAWVRQLGLPFNTSHYGLLGHSIGGAAAVGVLAASRNEAGRYEGKTILGALNYDGGFFEGQASVVPGVADVGAPVLLMGSEAHYNTTLDPTWESFTAAQTGWWREVVVNGSMHLDYSDISFWKELTPDGKVMTPEVGGIGSARMEEIKSVYTRAFFDCLSFGTEPTVLHGPSEMFPEVNYIGSGNGTASV